MEPPVLISHEANAKPGVSAEQASEISKAIFDNRCDNVQQFNLLSPIFDLLMNIYQFNCTNFELIFRSFLFVQTVAGLGFTIFVYTMLAVQTSYHLTLLCH